ncbi:hypothetical protein ACFX2I_039609 [Malus domestica]
MSNRNLIVFLYHGVVPKEYFMELLMKDLENTQWCFLQQACSSQNFLMGFVPSCSVFPIALSYGGMDDDYNTFKLMSSHIRVEE